MIGVVLSGGQSTRMGQDKGLIHCKGKTWTEIALEKLTALPIRTFVSINQHQAIQYAENFYKNDLIIDNANLKIYGPLAGLMSVHIHYPDQDIMVAACDLIQLESTVLEKLFQEFQLQQPEAMAFKNINAEPLCAIYSSQGLKKINTLYAEGKLTKHSMMHVLETLNTIYLPIKKEWQSFFKNFNQAEDLTQLVG